MGDLMSHGRAEAMDAFGCKNCEHDGSWHLATSGTCIHHLPDPCKCEGFTTQPTAQDELLAAAKAVVESHRDNGWSRETTNTIDLMAAAIAKVEAQT